MAIAELRNSIPVVDLCTGEEEERATYVKRRIANLTQARKKRCAKETVQADKSATHTEASTSQYDATILPSPACDDEPGTPATNFWHQSPIPLYESRKSSIESKQWNFVTLFSSVHYVIYMIK